MLMNRYMVDLIIEIKKKGYVTRKTQTTYKSSMGFFPAMRWLRDNKLISCDGVTVNKLKMWKLNDKGLAIAQHLEGIKKIFEGN